MQTTIRDSYMYRLLFEIVTCADHYSRQLHVQSIIRDSYMCRLLFEIVAYADQNGQKSLKMKQQIKVFK